MSVVSTAKLDVKSIVASLLIEMELLSKEMARMVLDRKYVSKG